MTRLNIAQALMFFILCFACAYALYENCTHGVIEDIRNGECNDLNNNEDCYYDGGDCCECTVETTLESYDEDMTDFFCIDPDSGCVDPLVDMYRNCTGIIENIGNGRCNLENNNQWCGYDGGDCCLCTRSNDRWSSYTDTSISFSYCVDPSHSCYKSSLVSIESSCIDGIIRNIQNGQCDAVNNNEDCLYDGGDCCSCTCVDSEDHHCGMGGYDCEDPDVVGLEDYICIEPPTNETFCKAELKRDWVVENETQALMLADVVRCAGGSFNVIWKGSVILNETISIFDGTVLNLTSVDDDAAIVGDREKRLFAVVNASLHLQNIHITNGSSIFGGAIAASRSTLTLNQVIFSGNIASSGGGAVFLSNGSVASFNQNSSFFKNTAFRGGALYVMGHSNASWTGNATFSDNVSTSAAGGAVYVSYSSNTLWKSTSNFVNNSAYLAGGAVCVVHGSTAVWAAVSYFLANSAEAGGGGALFIDGSSVVWTAASQFFQNSANDVGGALYIAGGSTANWIAESDFMFNTAGEFGGALYVKGGSIATWVSGTYFSENSALSKSGGALYVLDASSLNFNAKSLFLANSAQSDGGALSIENSTGEWTGETHFSANSAQSYGGAVYATGMGSLAWINDVIFDNNTADYGGALFITNGVTTDFSGEARFTSNNAFSNGGAVGSMALNSELSVSSSGAVTVVNDEDSSINFNGGTSFINNTCGANGGGMSLVQSLEVKFSSEDITFLHNSAEVSGGAVYISGTGIGTVFVNVTFENNVAQTGGGVHATGSGTTVTIEGDEQTYNPTTFYGCSFVGNTAFATGGAVDSASGQDVFLNTLFKGNTARVGGAMRLAGSATIENCSFDDNISDLDEGPAVSNVGFISNVNNVNFGDNLFNCESQTFLDFNKSADVFEKVCDGCPACVGCTYGENKGSPTCTSLSEAGIEYATSEGGTTTLEELQIQEGFWRATNTSININECFYNPACAGGLTSASDFCLQGYEGPYCSVCSKNYVPSLRSTCRGCSNRTVRIAIATLLTLLALAVFLAVVWFLVSGEGRVGEQGSIERVLQRIPMHSVKIIIVMWQILTQFASVANVAFPSIYETFLDGVDLFNLDLSWVASAGCFVELDFHDRLLLATITPLVVMGLLGGTYTITVCRNHGSSQSTLRRSRHNHVSAALLVTFLVYSNVSSVVFQMFACEDHDDGNMYLRADYSIECDSPKHRILQFYAGLMIMVYPIGIPVMYASILFSIRHTLRDEKDREESLVARSSSTLWQPYKPKRFYYEVIECGRRMLLSGVVAFIYPNTAAQIADILVIAVAFMLLSEVMAPYQSQWDVWISRTGHVILVASIYLALLLKVDVSDEDAYSQEMFEVTLVVVHGCLIFTALVEAAIMIFSLRAEKLEEDPMPKWKEGEDPRFILQRSSNFRWIARVSFADDDDHKDDV